MRLLLIINPISGTNAKSGLAQLASQILVGHQLSVSYTTCTGDATNLAKRAVAEGFDGVIAAGGDGTINETAIALCDTGVPLGIIPCGSGNGLARHLGIPMDMALALRIIAECHIVRADYGTVNSQPFFCTFGVGFDAAVSHRFARQHRRGKLSYIRSAISEYIAYHPQIFTIKANGEVLTEKAFLVTVCNASQYGNNAYIAPEASLTDGLLDITVVHAGTPFDAAILGVDMFMGFINSNTMIHTFRAKSAQISRQSNGPAHIDGEPVTLDPVMDVECHHGGISLFAPTHKTVFRPIITPLKAIISDLGLNLKHIIKS